MLGRRMLNWPSPQAHPPRVRVDLPKSRAAHTARVAQGPYANGHMIQAEILQQVMFVGHRIHWFNAIQRYDFAVAARDVENTIAARSRLAFGATRPACLETSQWTHRMPPSSRRQCGRVDCSRGDCCDWDHRRRRRGRCNRVSRWIVPNRKATPKLTLGNIGVYLSGMALHFGNVPADP